MKLTLLDNRDSFVWNLFHLAKSAGAEVELHEARTARLKDFTAAPPEALLIGPGPGHPREAELSRQLFRALPGTTMLGVCLGHQALALAHGASITASPELAHGRPVEVHHEGSGLFRGLSSPCLAGRYHSLTVDPASLPESLSPLAVSPTGELLAIAHRTRPHFGVQFHPESILSDCGPALLTNFLELARRAR